ATRGEVDVPAVPAHPRGPGGRLGVECKAAHEPDEEAPGGGEVNDPERLGERVVERSDRGPGSRRARRHRPRSVTGFVRDSAPHRRSGASGRQYTGDAFEIRRLARGRTE